MADGSIFNFLSSTLFFNVILQRIPIPTPMSNLPWRKQKKTEGIFDPLTPWAAQPQASLSSTRRFAIIELRDYSLAEISKRLGQMTDRNFIQVQFVNAWRSNLLLKQNQLGRRSAILI